jgi:hypothetical protein
MAPGHTKATPLTTYSTQIVEVYKTVAVMEFTNEECKARLLVIVEFWNAFWMND